MYASCCEQGRGRMTCFLVRSTAELVDLYLHLSDLRFSPRSRCLDDIGARNAVHRLDRRLKPGLHPPRVNGPQTTRCDFDCWEQVKRIVFLDQAIEGDDEGRKSHVSSPAGVIDKVPPALVTRPGARVARTRRGLSPKNELLMSSIGWSSKRQWRATDGRISFWPYPVCRDRGRMYDPRTGKQPRARKIVASRREFSEENRKPRDPSTSCGTADLRSQDCRTLPERIAR
nr:hypothetical protein CFP56_12900 [Quercus suber]